MENEMNEETRQLNSAYPEDRPLVESLLMAREARQPQDRGAPCPLHLERENLIWAYADGFLEEAEEDQAWEEISQCPHCLHRLAGVQRALREAEAWAPVPRPTPIPPSDDRILILALFNVVLIGKASQRIEGALTVAKLRRKRLMGKKKEETWESELSQTWADLQVTISIKVQLGLENRPSSMTASVDLRDQIGQPVSQTQVDFCDVRGIVMETGITDHKGHVGFSSQESKRFMMEKETQAEIGFCLGLIRGPERVKWQIVIGQEPLSI